MNRPIAVRKLTTPMAIPFVAVGRMMIASLGIPHAGAEAGSGPDDATARRVFAQGERLAGTAMRATTQPTLDPDLVTTAKAIVADLTAGVPEGYRTAPATTLLGRMRELGVTEREATGLSALLLVAGTET